MASNQEIASKIISDLRLCTLILTQFYSIIVFLFHACFTWLIYVNFFKSLDEVYSKQI